MNTFNKTFLVILLALSVSPLCAQQYIYQNGRQMRYDCDSSSAMLIVWGDTNALKRVATCLTYIFHEENDIIVYSKEDDVVFVHSDSLPTISKENIVNTIYQTSHDSISFFTYAKIINSNRYWFRNEILIELKEDENITSFESTFQQYNVTSFEIDTLQEYIIHCFSEEDMISLANWIYESGRVVYSSPDYYGGISLHSTLPVDPLFIYQYYLCNTGQVIPNLLSNNEFGTAGMDIKAVEAWEFLLQTRNDLGDAVRIAVIDDGVEDHEDLRTGTEHRVLTGWTCGGGDGSPMDGCKHGQCVSGIIAAEHNNICIAGISPNSLIVPIRIQKDHEFLHLGYNYPYYSAFFSHGKIARAIRKSWKKFNAEVINCSWGGNGLHDKILKTIQRAILKGRNEKGCVVVASSGNDSFINKINDIGDLQDVIGVGALDKNGVRASYSNYLSGNKPGISVVAFGGRHDIIDTQEGCDIRTIDREGSKGYTNINFYNFFSATSAAAPMVSGVASLMLSVNSNLTSVQVKSILEQTAQKLNGYVFSPISSDHPNGTWNEEVGYGLVDAHKAVVYAMEYGYDIDIIGDDNLSDCQSNTYSCSILHPELFTYQWSCSSNLSISNANGATITVIPLSVGSGSVSVEV